MTRIIVNDFDCRNNYATFGTKLGVWYFHMGGFSEIVQTKFQRCPLFICFITVDALVVGYQVKLRFLLGPFPQPILDGRGSYERGSRVRSYISWNVTLTLYLESQ